MKKYIKIVAICFFGTQISGLIIGLPAGFHFAGDSIFEPGSLEVIPIALLLGTMFTIVPTLIYALIMSFIILKNREKSRPRWLDFAISTSLVIVTYFITFRVLIGRFSFANVDFELLSAALFAGIVGVAITHRCLHRNKQMHNQQVDPIVPTPVDKVEAQCTQGHP